MDYYFLVDLYQDQEALTQEKVEHYQEKLVVVVVEQEEQHYKWRGLL